MPLNNYKYDAVGLIIKKMKLTLFARQIIEDLFVDAKHNCVIDHWKNQAEPPDFYILKLRSVYP